MVRHRSLFPLALSLILAAGPALAGEEPSADLILRHGVVYSGDDAVPDGTAIAVRGARILAIGGDADIARFEGRKTQVVDLAGRFVMAGFIDSHTHITEGGDYVSGVQLRDARTLAEVQRRVADFASAHPEKSWILGEAWSYGYPDMEKGEPTRQMLDARVSDRPIYLGSGMAHAGWVNSKALELLGITAATPDPEGGVYVRDAAGNPTGWLKEGAVDKVRSMIPAAAWPSPDEAMKAAMAEAGRVGVTRLVSAGGDWDKLPLLARWEKDKALTTRFSISLWQLTTTLPKDFFSKIADGKKRYHDDWVRTGAVKFILDGVIESHTGFLPDGYADQPGEKGMDFWPAARQKELVKKLNGMGIQVYTHAIGDGAISQTLDAYEASNHPELRNRIEHYETPYAADIPRLAKLSVVASMQPAMIYPKDQWMGMEGMWQRLAGDDRAKRAFPIRSVLDQHGAVAFGTDWPIIDLNPLLGIRDAVQRQSADHEPAGGWVPSERIGVKEAIRAYTLGAAWACHREADEGSLAPGKLADFIILDRDITRIDPDQIAESKVLATYVGGRQVYRR